MVSEVLKDALRAVSSGLQIPTIIILIVLIIISVLMLGSVIAEFFSERKALKESIPKLIDSIQGKSMSEMKAIIFSSELLKRQKRASEILIDRIKYPDNTREALARQLLADEENRYSRITKITDIVARTAPMFGLMGTLIPLGPGLIALGQGDTKTLSDSLLIAFDTTVAGLISGAISYVISGIRKSWYEQYIIGLETVFEAILEEQSRERKKAYRRMQQQNSGSIKG
ncbi:MAG: MotA/TolQ/ExbB proton channel family protein [Firmicutes bacterium]|nr:MotA/TolQ/ExbB proton channel family protein [Bacillota bacterium]MDY6173670.1 MotA/TolQ/ExbB proton channel family protein [Lentihominibacter sp.]